jgi:hypothetical protein
MSDRPTRKERQSRSNGDSRTSEKEVLTTKTGAANSGYAYHDVGPDGTPRCGAGGSSREFESVTIAEAQRRNKAPCKICRKLR